MKKTRVLIITLLLASTASLPVIAAEPATSPASGTQTAPEKRSDKEVRKEVGEAVDSIKSYSTDKRDEAMKKVKAALDDFDARMEKLKQQTQENKEKVEAELKEKRQLVAKRYEELKRATKRNWEKAKSRFLKDYREMEQDYQDKVDPFLAKNGK